jgi:hypothetical protein
MPFQFILRINNDMRHDNDACGDLSNLKMDPNHNLSKVRVRVRVGSSAVTMLMWSRHLFRTMMLLGVYYSKKTLLVQNGTAWFSSVGVSVSFFTPN